jgi:hypothetical protein
VPRPLPPDKLPPKGAVLALQEVKDDGRKETVGTLVIITPDGKCLTALHCISWDGQVHPDKLQAGGFNMKCIEIFPDDDLAALQLLMDNSSAASSRSSSSSSGSWPSLEWALHSRGVCPMERLH